MTTDPTSSRSDESSIHASSSGAGSSTARGAPRFTRAGAAWVAVGVALLLLILLIVFMLQNSTKVDVHFLGMEGRIPLGLALLIAAVGGGVVVAIAGVARITQLRINVRRSRRSSLERD
jgi:uncharacterized integral membrane protein